MLHFFDNEVLWECQDHAVCQYGQGSDLRRGHFAPDDVDVWWKWVAIYSNLAITYPSDRLPAISGLANHLHGLHRDTLGDYLARLWRNRLVEDLQWWASEIDCRPRPAVWRAPTWSWESIDSPVSIHDGGKGTKHVTVLETNAYLKDQILSARSCLDIFCYPEL